MKVFQRLFNINQRNYPKTYYKYKSYPPCGREYCYCIKNMKLESQKNKKLYHECYRTWYIYFHM